VQLWRRARVDWSRPDVAVGREPFLVLAASVIGVLAQWTDPGSAGELLGAAIAVGACIAFGLGARLPLPLFAVLVVVPVTIVVGHDGDLEGAMFLPVVATLYISWYAGSTVRAALMAAAAAVAPFLVAEVLAPEAGIVWTPWTIANVFTFAMGRTLHQQRTLIAELRAAREALAEQAVAEERRRIARELHDLAGHTLAAMMLHVTGARHVLNRDPCEAETALRDAEEVGRRSLDQIRATVAALRTDELGTDPALAGASDLDALVDDYRRAGLRIDAQLDLGVVELAGPVGTAVHRIVQEALANVARHAPGNAVTVVLTTTAGAVTVSVTDQGRPPPATPTTGSHFGLVGMRERARALGGELVAGPHARGWRVRATLPVTTRPSSVEASWSGS
jgi:signal transduction histidine kinase